jgi:hypothetical protein
MSYKCFILTKKSHFRAYNAPPSGALVFVVCNLNLELAQFCASCEISCRQEVGYSVIIFCLCNTDMTCIIAKYISTKAI